MGWARLIVFKCVCVCECVHTCVCVLMCGFVGLGVHAGGVCVFLVVGGWWLCYSEFVCTPVREIVMTSAGVGV